MKKFSVDATDFFSVLHTTKRSQAATMNLEPGQSTGGPDNRHTNSDQWLLVLEGSAKVIVESKEIKLEKHNWYIIFMYC